MIDHHISIIPNVDDGLWNQRILKPATIKIPRGIRAKLPIVPPDRGFGTIPPVRRRHRRLLNRSLETPKGEYTISYSCPGHCNDSVTPRLQAVSRIKSHQIPLESTTPSVYCRPPFGDHCQKKNISPHSVWTERYHNKPMF